MPTKSTSPKRNPKPCDAQPPIGNSKTPRRPQDAPVAACHARGLHLSSQSSAVRMPAPAPHSPPPPAVRWLSRGERNERKWPQVRRTDARAVADLRHRGDRLRVRHLRAAGAAADPAAGAGAIGRPDVWQPRVHRLGAAVVLHPGAGWRTHRAGGRLPDRPAGPSPRADLEHFAVRGFGVRRGL